MQCQQIQHLLNDYIDRELPVLQEQSIEQHCAICHNCAKDLALLQQQHRVFMSLPAIAIPDGLSQRVIQQAVTTTIPASTQPIATKRYQFAAAAMLAGIVMCMSLVYYMPASQQGVIAASTVAVDNSIHTIKMAIHSDKALTDVSLAIDLSDNLELDGFGNKKQIRWTTTLHKGVNVIALPIIGIAQGDGRITTHIRFNGKEKIMHINTQFQQPDNVRLITNEVLEG